MRLLCNMALAFFAFTLAFSPSPAPAQDALPAFPLFIMNADGTNRRQLVELEEFPSTGSPAFSADGKKLAFDAWRSHRGESSSKAHIIITDADGKNHKDLGDGAMPSWSPDGKQIVFTRYSPNSGVWTMKPDGTDKTLIDRSGWCGQWSPDGKKIAYTKYQGSGANLCIFDVTSRAQTFVFEYDEDSEAYRQIQWNFCWSPDSQQICFKGRKNDDQYEIAVVDIEGPEEGYHVCFELEKPPAEDLDWHPSGKKILASMINTQEKNTRQLFTFEPKAGTVPKPIPNQDTEWANLNGTWTPDGKRIVFSSRKLERK